MTQQEELKIRLEQHKMWLMDISTGKRFVAASGEKFREANLQGANLREAYLRGVCGFKFTPLQVVNTKYFITILDDHILWGCKKMTFDEVKKFEFKDCQDSSWKPDEFKLNKKIITEMIRYYRPN